MRNLYLSVFCAVSCGIAAPHPSVALPPDPQRPFQAQTCDQALARLSEALLGSPLVSAAEEALVLRAAQAQAVTLCGPDHPEIPIADISD